MKIDCIRLEPTENGCSVVISGKVEKTKTEKEDGKAEVEPYTEWVDIKINGSKDLFEMVRSAVQDVIDVSEKPKATINPKTFK